MDFSNEIEQELRRLSNVGVEGEKASQFLKSQNWEWFNRVILNAIEERALSILRNADKDTERVKAQQMIMVPYEIRKTLSMLSNEGEAARERISELSTQQGGREE